MRYIYIGAVRLRLPPRIPKRAAAMQKKTKQTLVFMVTDERTRMHDAKDKGQLLLRYDTIGHDTTVHAGGVGVRVETSYCERKETRPSTILRASTPIVRKKGQRTHHTRSLLQIQPIHTLNEHIRQHTLFLLTLALHRRRVLNLLNLLLLTRIHVHIDDTHHSPALQHPPHLLRVPRTRLRTRTRSTAAAAGKGIPKRPAEPAQERLRRERRHHRLLLRRRGRERLVCRGRRGGLAGEQGRDPRARSVVRKVMRTSRRRRREVRWLLLLLLLLCVLLLLLVLLLLRSLLRSHLEP
jgi:hypothetical protein